MVKMDLSSPDQSLHLTDVDNTWPVRKPVKGVPDTWRMDVPMDLVRPRPTERKNSDPTIGFWTELPMRNEAHAETEHVLRSFRPAKKTISADRSMLGEMGRFLILIYGLVIAMYLVFIVNKPHL